MKKALMVLVFLGLTASLIGLFSLMGQADGLRAGKLNAEMRRDSLQKMYDEAKEKTAQIADELEEATVENARLTGEADALRQQITALNALLQSAQAEAQSRAASERQAQDALSLAQAGWEKELRAATEEKDSAVDHLTEALVLLRPEPLTAGSAALKRTDNLFAGVELEASGAADEGEAQDAGPVPETEAAAEPLATEIPAEAADEDDSAAPAPETAEGDGLKDAQDETALLADGDADAPEGCPSRDTDGLEEAEE